MIGWHLEEVPGGRHRKDRGRPGRAARPAALSYHTPLRFRQVSAARAAFAMSAGVLVLRRGLPRV